MIVVLLSIFCTLTLAAPALWVATSNTARADAACNDGHAGNRRTLLHDAGTGSGRGFRRTTVHISTAGVGNVIWTDFV